MSTGSSLSTHVLTVRGAPLEGADPLPHPHALIEAGFTLAEDLPPEVRERGAIGRPRSMHPYLVQDRYGRERHPVDLETVVLDNGVLRAVFVPSLGGRLWSLRDVAADRELLFANPALQPGNLALRNAWFAGGVEWNIGTKGHAAHTMAPLHAARVAGPGGVPMLRMWELDRLRRVVFQVDAWLPERSRALHVYVRIQNRTDQAVPMYWWSNAAVPEADDVRVLAPARSAFATTLAGTVERVPVPVHEGRDVTRSTLSPHAEDHFFDIPAGTRPWVAAVGADGHGLLQSSTDRLMGRKLFCWGTGAGGRHWQDWLSPEGGRYLEIQAGLLPTQFEHVLMPARADWDWVEVYGDADASAEVTHGGNWGAAVAHLADAAERLVPSADLAAALEAARAVADTPPVEHLSPGSGWGALERELVTSRGVAWDVSPGTPFPEQGPDGETELWRALLTDPEGAARLLADADPGTPPPSYVLGGPWEDVLAAHAPGWARDYHLGVLAHARGALDEAAERYRSSAGHAATPWATRGLGLVAGEQGRPTEAADLLTAAAAAAPGERTITCEAMTAELAADRPERALRVAEAAPEHVRESGRVRLLRARAAWLAGEGDVTRQLLEEGIVVPDLREGERELSDLWLTVFPDRPVPAAYDYRMS